MSGREACCFSVEFPSENEHMFLEMHEVFACVCRICFFAGEEQAVTIVIRGWLKSHYETTVGGKNPLMGPKKLLIRKSLFCLLFALHNDEFYKITFELFFRGSWRV